MERVKGRGTVSRPSEIVPTNLHSVIMFGIFAVAALDLQMVLEMMESLMEIEYELKVVRH